jgi:hypothetical protein
MSNPTEPTASLERDCIEAARVLIKMMLLRHDWGHFRITTHAGHARPRETIVTLVTYICHISFILGNEQRRFH